MPRRESENGLFRRSMVTNYTDEDELARIVLLLAVGMGTHHTARLVGRARSTVYRMVNPAALAKHRSYNRMYMRRKRAEKKS